MVATMALAREEWQSRFAAADAAAASQAQALKEQRKNTELVYRIGPKEDPELLEDGIYCGDGARDPANLPWAEQRLSSLGFETVADGRIRSYTQVGEDFIVYADPRAKGEISFRVYRIPPPKRLGGSYQCFVLKDSGKNDLAVKYKVRLSAAVARAG
jgi:hypothetical protein